MWKHSEDVASKLLLVSRVVVKNSRNVLAGPHCHDLSFARPGLIRAYPVLVQNTLGSFKALFAADL